MKNTYIGHAEAARLLGIGQTNFSHLRRKQEGVDPAFPLPVAKLKCGPIWLEKDMVKYRQVRAIRNGTIRIAS